MLEISGDAAEAIRSILAAEGVPAGATFRISVEPPPEPGGESGFAVSVTESPPVEDEVVAGDDVEIRVEPAAAEILDDKQLDASISHGRVLFSLSEQAA
jgi:iron-sulfur cluster assembly protein